MDDELPFRIANGPNRRPERRRPPPPPPEPMVKPDLPPQIHVHLPAQGDAKPSMPPPQRLRSRSQPAMPMPWYFSGPGFARLLTLVAMLGAIALGFYYLVEVK